MSKLTSNQNFVCFGIPTLNILEHISWVNCILQKLKLYAKWKASKMPTKTFITPFYGENKVNIAGNEKKYLHGYSYSKKIWHFIKHISLISKERHAMSTLPSL